MANNHETEKLARNEDREHATRRHDEIYRRYAESARIAVESANVAIRAMILVNGAAAVALLAFLASFEAGALGNSIKIDAVVKSLYAFAAGVGLSLITAALAYLVNYLDNISLGSVRLKWEHAYVEDGNATPRIRWWRNCLHILAIILVVGSLSTFFFGIITMAQAISALAVMDGGSGPADQEPHHSIDRRYDSNA